MEQEFKLILEITLADGGNGAGDVINLYGSRVRDDIDQIAWNLCDCDNEVQSEKFGALELKDWLINHKHGDPFYVKAKFTVKALNEEFINQVIEDYMDGFADCITVSRKSLYSRTGEQVGFNPSPIEWELNIE